MRSIAVTKPDMGVLPRERVLPLPLWYAGAGLRPGRARPGGAEGGAVALPASGAAGGGRGERASRRPGPGQPPGGSPPGAGGPAPGGGGRHSRSVPPSASWSASSRCTASTRLRGPDRTEKKTGGREGGSTPGAVRQAFYQSLIQHISITPILFPPASLSRGGYALASGARPWRRVLPWLQTAEKEGQDRPPGPGSAPGAGGSSTCPECGGPPVRSPAFSRPAGTSALPPEELALQEIRGDQGAGSRMAPLLTQTGLERLAERALSSLSRPCPMSAPLSGEPAGRTPVRRVRDPGRLSGYEAGARRGGAALPTEPSVPGREAALRPQRGRAGQGGAGAGAPCAPGK